MRRIGLSRSAGMIVLGIWLILSGLVTLLTLGIPNQNIILGVLALIAGILIILGI